MIDRHEVARIIVQDVAELSDRSSPEDRPDLMLVTADELRDIVLLALPSISPLGEPTEGMVKAAAEAIMRVADQQVAAPRVRYRRGGQDHKQGGCFHDQASAALSAAFRYRAEVERVNRSTDREIDAALRPLPLQEHGGKAVADEREACAHIADIVGGRAAKAAMELSYGELYGEQCKEEAAEEIANAIRARSMVAEDRGIG